MINHLQQILEASKKIKSDVNPGFQINFIKNACLGFLDQQTIKNLVHKFSYFNFLVKRLSSDVDMLFDAYKIGNLNSNRIDFFVKECEPLIKSIENFKLKKK